MENTDGWVVSSPSPVAHGRIDVHGSSRTQRGIWCDDCTAAQIPYRCMIFESVAALFLTCPTFQMATVAAVDRVKSTSDDRGHILLPVYVHGEVEAIA